ncbi:hypothetical protein HAX54_051663, partial [Datura stramonium]|nr:hypothetical protein [Datura stramonium]
CSYSVGIRLMTVHCRRLRPCLLRLLVSAYGHNSRPCCSLLCAALLHALSLPMRRKVYLHIDSNFYHNIFSPRFAILALFVMK